MATKTDRAEISKIVLNIAGKEISLTPDQARQLHSALDEMYGEKVVEHHHHDDYRRPYWPWLTSSYSTNGGDLSAKFDSGTALLSLK